MTPKAFAGHDFFRKQQTAFFTEDNKGNEGMPEFQSPSALCPLSLLFPSVRSGRFVRISRSCREAHYFLFAYRENCLPGSGRKSFLHIFSGALNQSLGGI